MSESLIDAWTRWNSKPSSEKRANRKEDELRAAGFQGRKFHDDVAAERSKAGLRTALERVIAQHKGNN